MSIMNPVRPSFVCASCARGLRSQTPHKTWRLFATTATRDVDALSGVPDEGLPRWRQTPRAMTMPVRVRPRPDRPVWRVNTSEAVVDKAFDDFVGGIGGREKGSQLLDAETKWLALTHKSFDHGRQGFNDRLAFLGKRIVDWQTSSMLLYAPESPATKVRPPVNEVYRHPSLDGLENVTASMKDQLLHKSRLASLALKYNIDRAVRWTPKRTDDLQKSGQDVVLAHAVYSMVGALAMRQGGGVAARVVRERILQPLGLR